jgi:hypothetical protein
MNFNLKTKPILDSDNLDKFDAIAARVWFEGFEEELRKRLEFEEEQTKKLDREQSMVAHFLIDLIKEILGVS